MKSIFKDKNILITGGTGSIGQEIMREVLKHEPTTVRILDLLYRALKDIREKRVESKFATN